MTEPLDIIGGVNSLDDVLSSTAHAITAVSGDVDALRKAAATSNKAKDLLATILDEIRTLLSQSRHLCEHPDDQHVRGEWAKTANYLHDLGEDALILLSELKGTQSS